MKKLTNQERMDLLNFITDEKMARSKAVAHAERTGEGNVQTALRKLQIWLDIQTRMNGKPNEASQVEFELIELEQTRKGWLDIAKLAVEENRRMDSLLPMRRVKFLDLIIEHFTPMAAPVGKQQQLFS
jgi:hypothetical protein